MRYLNKRERFAMPAKPLAGRNHEPMLRRELERDTASLGFAMPPSDTPDRPPKTEPALRAIAMPADANPHGDIFGGWLLSQMDLAGGAAARRRAKGRTA